LTVDRTTRLEETSFWARQIGPYEPGPPLRGSLDVDVAIVGAGFTGLNTARELKRLAEGAGARVFECTPVTGIQRQGGRIRLETPGGVIHARKLVLATNAYSRLVPDLPRIRSRQAPVWTFQVVTEPLSNAQWESIGWAERQSFEDNRQLIHYFRPTVDGRITMGGGDVGTPYGDGLDRDFSPRIWRHLEDHLRWIFPQLRELGFEYRWGGPVSVNFDMAPEVGFIGDERVVYATGYIGHGVSLSHLNGRLIADLLAGERTELTDFWIVNRKAIPWPGEPLSCLGKKLVRSVLRTWDLVEERGLRSSS
jgi:glycine/D-amino acid oxidase-like deaminating enzyme